MARTTYPNNGPRTDLRANREVRQASRGLFSPAFGIKRWLLQEYDDGLADTLTHLQNTMQLPSANRLELRRHFAVTLLSQRVLANQLQRGRVTYDLGRLTASLLHNPSLRQKNDTVPGVRGEVHCMGNRVFYVMIEGAAIEDEIDGIEEAFMDTGLRPAAKETSGKPSNPHMTIAQTPQGIRLSDAEVAHAKEILNLEMGDYFEYESWDPEPSGIIELAS